MTTRIQNPPVRPARPVAASQPDAAVVIALRSLPTALRRLKLPIERVASTSFDLAGVPIEQFAGGSGLSPAAKAQLATALRDPKLRAALRYWYGCDNPGTVTGLDFTVEIVDSRILGVESVEVNGINDAGDIVGRWFRSGSGGSAFKRSATGQVLDLCMDNALSINNAGVVVGYSVVRSAGGFEYLTPMVFDPGTGTARALAAVMVGAGLAVNNEGQVAVGVSQASGLSSYTKSLVLNLASQATLREILMPVANVQTTAAHGLNDAGFNPYLGGVVVGSYSDPSQVRQGFELDDAGYRSVERSGARAVVLRSVNNQREVVGFETIPDPSDATHKRLTSRGLLYRCGVAFSYGLLGDASKVCAPAPEFHGINNRSQVVGSFTDHHGLTRGFVATPV